MRNKIVVAIACAVVGCGDETVAESPANDGVWVFQNIEGMACGDGSATGIGINTSAASSRLIIHLQGGGACYSQDGCLGPEPSTSNFDGYGADEFEQFVAEAGVHGKFDRTDPLNPFRDDDYVFVPYCTGDVHAGDRVAGDLNYVGQRNLKALLPEVLDTFAGADSFVLSGSSAGAFGAMFNFWLVQDAFGSTPGMLVNDSGPFFNWQTAAALALVVDIWGVEGTIAPGCDLCLETSAPDGGMHHLVEYYADNYPDMRGSLISSLQDETIGGFFNVQPEAYEEALFWLVDEIYPINPSFRSFLIDGEHHVWLDGDEDTHHLSDVVSGGVPLSEFLQQQLDADPAWTDVRP